MDNTGETLGAILSGLLGQGPAALVALVGLLVALSLRQRAPTAAALAASGCGLLLLGGVAFTLLNVYLQTTARVRYGWDIKQFTWALSASGMIGSVVQAVALGLLLGAAFTGRGDRAHDAR